MKKCEKCQKEYDDNLSNCPYCSSEFATETTGADSHNETKTPDHELYGNNEGETEFAARRKIRNTGQNILQILWK